MVSLCLALLATSGTVAAEILAARYDAPTKRYDHGILGDSIEWAALVLTLDGGRKLTVTLPATRVFEDIAPRLVDLDHDGAPEVITVETSLTKGARLSIYGEKGVIAATPFIGRPHRWLAPIGAADLDGDGYIEIAYVDRPHLAKILRIWRFQAGSLRFVADSPGLTNHRIGWHYILGGIRTCDGQPEIITANADWTVIMASTLKNNSITRREIGAYSNRQSMERAVSCR